MGARDLLTLPSATRGWTCWYGPKLVGNDWVNRPFQGASVALSADGNTAIIGGSQDNAIGFETGIGAAWVWNRSGNAWTQQGPKLVGTGAASPEAQSSSVALSADGNTALVGGPWDNSSATFAGSFWVWTRGGGVWTQQGPKLVPVGAIGDDYLGNSVALSGDGNTAIITPGRCNIATKRNIADFDPNASLLSLARAGAVGVWRPLDSVCS